MQIHLMKTLLNIQYYDHYITVILIVILKVYHYTTATEFELDKPNISLTVFDENNEIIYISNNGSRSSNKAKIVKINNYRHAAIKPLKSNSIKLNEFMQLHSHLELRDLFFQNSRRNNITNLILLIFL